LQGHLCFLCGLTTCDSPVRVLLLFVPHWRAPHYLYIVACISDKPFSELQHVTSYVSHQYAMAYDSAQKVCLKKLG
jgi:hypothetical protein